MTYNETDAINQKLQNDVAFLQSILLIFQETKNVSIRWAILKGRCERILKEISNGQVVELSSSVYNSIVKRYESLEVIRRDKKGRKHSLIVADIPKVQHALDDISVKETVEKHTFEALHQDFQEMWRKQEKNTIEYNLRHDSSLLSLVTRFQNMRQNDFMIQALGEAMAPLRSSRWKVYVSPAPGKKFELSEEAMQRLYVLANKYLSRNTFPFQMVISYSGPFLDDEVTEVKEYEEMQRKDVENFVKWCLNFHNYLVNDDDKQNLINYLIVTKHGTLEAKTEYKLQSKTVELWKKFVEISIKYSKIALRGNILPPLN